MRNLLRGVVVVATFSLASVAVAGTSAALAGSVAGHSETPGSKVAERHIAPRVGDTSVVAVACSTVGNCAAGGDYKDRSTGGYQAFVVSETNGAWGRAVEVPGVSSPQFAKVLSVSCDSGGTCVAGGFYLTAANTSEAFLVREQNGAWGMATRLSGSGSLDPARSSFVDSVSCTSAGDCSAGGSSIDRSGKVQAFVATESNGTWGPAVEVPGVALLNSAGSAVVSSLACPSVGNCSAAGSYLQRIRGGGVAYDVQQAFVVSESNGTWGRATEVPGSAKFNTGGVASVSEVSCGSVGNCSAVGRYRDFSDNDHAYVVEERGGAWGTVRQFPGSQKLNSGVGAFATSVSCGSPGNCLAGGGYLDGGSFEHAFLVSEIRGTWATVMPVPGLRRLDTARDASVNSVSCASLGNCSAGGFYSPSVQSPLRPFVINERNGHWSKALAVPGLPTTGVGGVGQVNSVFCDAPGECVAAGSVPGSSRLHGFVVSQHNGIWSTAQLITF